MGRYSRSISGSRSRSRSRSRGGGDSRDRSRDRSRNRHSRDRNGGDYRDQKEDDGHRVHVADLGVDCSQKELEKSFGKFGEIKEVWLAKNPPCFSFVVYKHKSDAEEAIKEMDGRVVCGSRVRVSWARPRTRGRNQRFDPNLRCYQCGQRGHFSRDCNGSRSGRGYRSSRYDDDDYDRKRSSRYSRRSRTRSRSRGSGRDARYRRERSYSRSRSRSASPKRDRTNGNDSNRQASIENEKN